MAVLGRAVCLACVAAQAAAYVVPSAQEVRASAPSAVRPAVTFESAAPSFEEDEVVSTSGSFAPLAVSVAVGAVLGWLNSRRQQVAAAAAAAAVALTPVAAPAYVEYEGIQYLGGSDKVDINNANVQAYRQFPGFYPSAAGAIATHGPYNSVSEVYDIPNLDETLKAIIKKYESNLVCLPPNPAYFGDRVNNFMYR